LKLLAIVEPLFSTHLTNRGIPFDLVIGWSVLNRPWFTNQKIFALVFGIILRMLHKTERLSIWSP